MSERKKIDPVLKVELVEKYLRDEIGIREAARQAGLSGCGTESFRKWVDIYRNEGPAGLLEQKSFKYYSQKLKISATVTKLDKGVYYSWRDQISRKRRRQLHEESQTDNTGRTS